MDVELRIFCEGISIRQRAARSLRNYYIAQRITLTDHLNAENLAANESFPRGTLAGIEGGFFKIWRIKILQHGNLELSA